MKKEYLRSLLIVDREITKIGIKSQLDRINNNDSPKFVSLKNFSGDGSPLDRNTPEDQFRCRNCNPDDVDYRKTPKVKTQKKRKQPG